jgi:flavin-dependent dehydrogenase
MVLGFPLAHRHFEIAIIGAGPAGSTAAMLLARSGFDVCLIEKRSFPREVLCGEFLSHEVTDHLKHAGLFEAFLALSPNPVRSLRLHGERGEDVHTAFSFPAYGLSRGKFDAFLLSAAKDAGATVLQPADVKEIVRTSGGFLLRLDASGEIVTLTSAKLVGAHGKRSSLDRVLRRGFVGERSPLSGFKVHVDARAFPRLDMTAIHLFARKGMYYGINAVDGGNLTVCWLERKKGGGIPPRLRLPPLLADAGISPAFAPQISLRIPQIYGGGNLYYGRKKVVVDGVFMIGDAAGMIAPLAGDGIGMAVESARLVSHIVREQRFKDFSDARTESMYSSEWSALFRKRRMVAGAIQTAILNRPSLGLCVRLANMFPFLLTIIIGSTRSGGADDSHPLM